MPSDQLPELDEVDEVLDGLSSPTSRQVFDAMQPYNNDIVAAGLGSRAMSGGGGGGSQPAGQAVYGDGSDGAVTYTGADLPDPSGVSAWNDATPYDVDDLVTSTGSNVRVFRCVKAGTSGNSDPFPDRAAGFGARSISGKLVNDGTAFWEQKTLIIDGFLEGNVYATDFEIAAGQTLKGQGWVIYATGGCTIPATATLNGDGADTVGSDPGGYLESWSVYPTLGLPGRGGYSPGNDGEDCNGLLIAGAGGFGGAAGDATPGTGPGRFDAVESGFGPLPAIRSLVSFISRIATLNPVANDLFVRVTSGGGGGQLSGASPGGGGGGGAWALAILANTITIAGTISARGGGGGDGTGEDAGGGGGAQGGPVYLIYDELDDVDATYVLTGGSGGSGAGTGEDGEAGSDGAIIRIPNA